MKGYRRQQILASFTFVALLIILAIQVGWVFNAAKLEEENFNKLVNKALIEAKSDIAKVAYSCADMTDFLCGYPGKETIQQKNIEKIDRIIRSKLDKYNIDLEYTFEVADMDAPETGKRFFGAKCYLQCLSDMLQQEGIKIMLEFPGRNKFLLAQLSGTFMLAFFSIIFVMISYVLTSRMFRKERQALQHTTDFINNMVHEFQTPLANIRLATNLIKKKEKVFTDSRIPDYLDVILNENHKLEKNVEEILKVSSFGNGNGNTNFVPIDMHKLIGEVSGDFETRVKALEGRIQCHKNANNAQIMGEPAHFRLILSNLIDNALKYSDGQPRITVSTSNAKSELILKVEDEGIGIDKKHHEQIFEKYFRVSTGDVHNVKGFGLGLTYVKKLVEKYNGKISVISTKGTGTQFTIVLPLKNEEDKNPAG